MLEIRNDLIATPEAQSAMAATLAPVLAAAMAALAPEPVM
jgi:predicted N-formylglutamate amidohydrolase